jgi:diguanylate cyclase (GGDEF)-like protein
VGLGVAAVLMVVLEVLDVAVLGVVRPPSPWVEALGLGGIAALLALSLRPHLQRWLEPSFVAVAALLSWRAMLFTAGAIGGRSDVEIVVSQTLLVVFAALLAPSPRAFALVCLTAIAIPLAMDAVGPTAGVLGPRALVHLPTILLALLPVGWSLQTGRAAAARALEDAEDLAARDPLTGLHNRRDFFARAERVFADPVADASLLYVDLDAFKALNDRLGHAEGDRVLCAVADRMQACLRPHDRLARIGGEEFAVLLHGATADAAGAVAERLRAAVDADPACRATVSVGVAARAPGEPLDRVLHRADAALYAAKTAGRNRVDVAPADAPDRPRRATPARSEEAPWTH